MLDCRQNAYKIQEADFVISNLNESTTKPICCPSIHDEYFDFLKIIFVKVVSFIKDLFYFYRLIG